MTGCGGRRGSKGALCTADPARSLERAGDQLWSPWGWEHSRHWTLPNSLQVSLCWEPGLMKMQDSLSLSKEHLKHSRCSPAGAHSCLTLTFYTRVLAGDRLQLAPPPGGRPWAALARGQAHLAWNPFAGLGRKDSRNVREVCPMFTRKYVPAGARARAHTHTHTTVKSLLGRL